MTSAGGPPRGGRVSRDNATCGPRPPGLWREIGFLMALGVGLYLCAVGLML